MNHKPDEPQAEQLMESELVAGFLLPGLRSTANSRHGGHAIGLDLQ